MTTLREKKIKTEPKQFEKAAKEAMALGDIETAKNYRAQYARLKTYVDENIDIGINERRYIVSKHENGNRKAVVYKDPEWSEHQVEFHTDGKRDENATYHTDDKEDAQDTAKHWVNHVDVRKFANESIEEVSSAAMARAGEHDWIRQSTAPPAPAVNAGKIMPKTTLVHTQTGEKTYHPSPSVAKSAWAAKPNPGHFHIESTLEDGTILVESYYNEELMGAKSEADRKSAAAYQHSNDLENHIDEPSSQEHLEGVRLHKVAADAHNIHSQLASQHLRGMMVNLTSAGAMNHEHLDDELDKIKHHMSEKNDSEHEVERHKHYIHDHLNQVTESALTGDEIMNLKSLREWVKPASETLKDLKGKETKTKNVKAYSDNDNDEDDKSPKTSKKSDGGKSLAKAMGVSAKDEIPDRQMRQLVGAGKAIRHVIKDGIEYTITKAGFNKFIAEVKEGEEIIFECTAPTESGAFSQMERILENAIEEACAKKMTPQNTLRIAKQASKRYSTKK